MDEHQICEECDALRARVCELEEELALNDACRPFAEGLATQAVLAERERIIAIITDPKNQIAWLRPGGSSVHADPRHIRAAIAPVTQEQEREKP